MKYTTGDPPMAGNVAFLLFLVFLVTCARGARLAVGGLCADPFPRARQRVGFAAGAPAPVRRRWR
jgi:hypothetical protein